MYGLYNYWLCQAISRCKPNQISGIATGLVGGVCVCVWWWWWWWWWWGGGYGYGACEAEKWFHKLSFICECNTAVTHRAISMWYILYKSMGLCKKDVTALLMHRNYVFLALTHRNDLTKFSCLREWYVFCLAYHSGRACKSNKAIDWLNSAETDRWLPCCYYVPSYGCISFILMVSQ